VKPLRFAVTPGEPAGIGPDLCLLLAADAQPHPLIAITSRDLLAERAMQLGLAVNLLPVLPGQWPDQPARTPGGFIILKLLAKRGGEAQMRDEVHVRHILVKPSPIRDEAKTQALVQSLYERILAGEDFAELAKNYSEDPGSALNGGDLNWIDPNALVPEFREVMAKTPQGQLSKPFQTQYGWHVLEVLGRRATDSTEQAREQQAMTVLRNRKYDEELQTWLRQIRDEAYVEIKLPGADQAAQ